MEGYNPIIGCSMGCQRLGRSWVPYPRTVFPRRDPLVDAYGRTDDPCARPARCGPFCKPTPKFRLPKELPECNINCFEEEQAEAKRRQACEDHQKFVKNCCPPPPCPEMIIEALDPNYPIAVELPDDTSPDQQCTFNQCDRIYLSGGENLPLYPCRGVIGYRTRVPTTFEEMNGYDQFVGQASKYSDPQYKKEQLEIIRQKEMEIRIKRFQDAEEERAKADFLNPYT